MRLFLSGAVCAAILAFTGAESRADHLYVLVPVGKGGSLTAPGTYQAYQQMRLIPGGADVVPAEKFKDGYALSMKDMLAATPGVMAQPRWGEESRLSIRGSGLSRGFHLRGVTLLQDGIPFNFADGSGDFQEIDPLTLQHVEVYRGGQALRYGAATLGGAVNMVTPTAHTVDYDNALLRLEGGSFGTVRTHGQAAQAMGNVDVFAATTRTISKGFRKQSEQNNARFSGNVGVMLSPQIETRFYVAWNDIEQDVPGTISKQAALHDPESVPAINILNDYSRDIRSVRLANRTVFALNDDWKLEAGGYVNDKSLYHPIFQVIDQDSIDAGLFSRVSGAQGRHDLVLGANIGRGVNNADRFVNVRGNRGALTADARQVARNLELYGEDSYSLTPQWRLVGGAQAVLSARDYEDHLNGANDDSKSFKSFNPKAGIIYGLTPQADIFASVTRSSEVPTFSELVQGAIPGFVPVDMQTAWTAEIGTRGRYESWGWDATFYHARVKDELLQFAVTPDVPASTFNADETIHQGVELGLSWQPVNRITLNGIYNYNDFRFDGDAQYGDNELAGASPHEFRLSVRYEDRGFHIEPGVEWVPEAGWVDYANTLNADSYTTVGVKVGYEVNRNISFFLDGRNLTNEKFIASYTTVNDARTANTNVFYPGDGRSVFGGVTVKF